MSPEDQVYYENYFDLFGESGWRTLVEDLKEMRNYLLETIVHNNNSEDIYITKGKIQALDYIIHFQELVENQYKSVLEEEKEEQDADLRVQMS